MTTENREELIRARAYQRWVAEGMPEGRETHHWYEAEKEVDAENDGGGGNGSNAASGEISALPEVASSASGPKARARASKSNNGTAGTGTSRTKRTTTKLADEPQPVLSVTPARAGGVATAAVGPGSDRRRVARRRRGRST